MKRVITFLLATVLLAGACFVTPVLAADPEDSMLMNFDFEETDGKAATDDKKGEHTLELFDSKSTGTINIGTGIKGGRMVLCADDADQAKIVFDDTLRDALATTDSVTFYFEVQLLTPAADFIDIFKLWGTASGSNVSRTYINQNTSKINTRIIGASGNTTKDSSLIVNLATTVCCALTLREDGDTTLATVKCSSDFGASWYGSAEASIANPKAKFSTLDRITLGPASTSKVAGANLAYDNIRVYTGTLDDATLSEIASANKASWSKEDQFKYVQYKASANGYDARLIASVPRNAKNAGFLVYAADNVSTSGKTGNYYSFTEDVTKCYTSVVAAGETVTAAENEGFIVCSISDIPTSTLPTITVLPWYETAEGVVVWGQTESFTVNSTDVPQAS